MNNSKLMMWGMIDSLGVFVYTLMVGWLMINGETLFGDKPGFFGPALFLMLFVFSALLTGLLILGRPIWLYLENQKKEAVKLLLYTSITLFLMIIAMVLILPTFSKSASAPSI